MPAEHPVQVTARRTPGKNGSSLTATGRNAISSQVTARRTPGKNGSQLNLTFIRRDGDVTARRTPGKNGSRPWVGGAPDSGIVTARRTPGKNGSGGHPVVVNGDMGSQPGERRARMEAGPARRSPASGAWSQPGERRARMEAWARRRTARPRNGVTARRTPGKNGSGVVHVAQTVRGRVTARRTPGKNGSPAPAQTRHSGDPESQPGERRARMEARPRRPSRSDSSPSQPGERRARMEATASTSPTAAGGSHSPANAGQEWKHGPGVGPPPRPGVTARRTPGKNGSRTRLVQQSDLEASQPGERRARMEARSAACPRASAARHSPANAGQEWKLRRQHVHRPAPHAVTARRTPGKNGSLAGPTSSAASPPASQLGERRARMKVSAGVRRSGAAGRHSPANAGQEWKPHLRGPGAQRSAVTARRTPGKNGSCQG